MTRTALFLLALLSGCTPAKFAGLLPLEPEPPKFVTDSPTPELRWQALPADGRVTDVVYDLRIYDSSGGIRVEREGLTEPRWRVETALHPETAYEWTVRARYRRDGARRRTEWTEREDTWSRNGSIDGRERRYVPLTFKPAP